MAPDTGTASKIYTRLVNEKQVQRSSRVRRTSLPNWNAAWRKRGLHRLRLHGLDAGTAYQLELPASPPTI
jgi:hypothetical protein